MSFSTEYMNPYTILLLYTDIEFRKRNVVNKMAEGQESGAFGGRTTTSAIQVSGIPSSFGSSEHALMGRWKPPDPSSS